MSSNQPQLQQITTLPLHKLNQRLVYLPGVTYKTVFDYDQGLQLLGRLAPFLKVGLADSGVVANTHNHDGNGNRSGTGSGKVGNLIRSVFGYCDDGDDDDDEKKRNKSGLHAEREEVDEDDKARQLTSRVIESMKLINETFQLSDDGNTMIMAFLPGFDYDSNTAANMNGSGCDDGNGHRAAVVTTVCKVTEVYQHENQIVLSLRALCRGLIVSQDGNGSDGAAPFIGEVLVSVPLQFAELMDGKNASGNGKGKSLLLKDSDDGGKKDKKQKIVNKKVQLDGGDGFEEKKIVQEFVNLQLDTLGAPGSKIPSDVSSKLVKQSKDVVRSIVRLLENIERFLDQYNNDKHVFAGNENENGNGDDDQEIDKVRRFEAIKDERLKHLFLRLSPISGLLHAQLSPSETQQGLKRLKEYYLSYGNASTIEQTQQISKFFLYNDVLTALFPFSVKQKVQVLNQLQYEPRLTQFAKCIEFANFLFEQSLNVDYILDCWKNLDTKPVSGDLLRSHFISDHLKTLRALVEHVGSATPRRVGRAVYMRPISGSAGSGTRNNSATSDENEEEDELKDISKFIAGLDDLVMSDDGKRLVKKDFRRLKQMQASMSSDYQVLRTYLEVIMDLPWVNKQDYTHLNTINVDLFGCFETP
ncbi:unnamed protein product [Ambrosiozyma monospora]|uniref:Unnamed protein product n=1 Tax=Ambrosiozyma monospora TaxID=43982 RepID=A0A9W6YYC5_AMBMO|nr:unnamed protein product [Ambrosiozyma monospora]